MRTPAGDECRYYYEDFHRGRSTQECRLIKREPGADPWTPKLCGRCPVPGILRANTCPHMVMEGRVVRRWLGLWRQVEVYAVCTKYQVEVEDPYVGCGHCHPQASMLFEVPEDNH